MNYIGLMQRIMFFGETISPRKQEIKELMYQDLEVENSIFEFKGVRELSDILKYWKAEFAWYMSGDREASKIEPYAKLWGKIKNFDGTLNSNYGFLVFYNKTDHPSEKDYKISMGVMTPFSWAARNLEVDEHSRQAVITYNTGGFNFVGNKDYICTQHQAFFIRNKKLHCYIALRSSDAIFGLTYNMPWWQVVTQQLLLRLQLTYPWLELGEMRVKIYSAHIYKQHYELVNKMLTAPIIGYNMRVLKLIPLGQSFEWYYENFEKLIEIKK